MHWVCTRSCNVYYSTHDFNLRSRQWDRVHVCVCLGSTRLWPTWGCGCETPSPPWRKMLCSWYPPWWSAQRCTTRTGTHEKPLMSPYDLFFLTLSLMFCWTQRNWCAVSWLHPHAEGSANPMEPLDLKVTLGRRSKSLQGTSHIVMCQSCASHPPSVTL